MHNILICDDDRDIVKALRIYLSTGEYRIFEAFTGQEAVDLVRREEIHLILMDIMMPVLDGIAAAERIAAQRICPVVILTAFSQRELVERARDAGAMAYLLKPFSRSDLAPTVEMAMARFAEVRALESEVADLGERLQTRKSMDRAKGLLQTELGISEVEAFRWIQKTAMDLRLSMRQVADGVIDHGPGIAKG